MKIIDCFPFFQELDLLEIRLKYLAPFVDQFVIVEADFTHAGDDKPFRFPHEAEWFQPYREKTTVLEMKREDVGPWSDHLPGIEQFDDNWKREKAQRQFIASIFPKIDDQDLLIFSDLDEIWNPDILDKMVEGTHDDRIVRLEQEIYYYSPDLLEITGGWNNARAARVKALRGLDLSAVRNDPIPRFLFRRQGVIHNAGWHFSYMGGLETVIAKFKSFSHQEFSAAGMDEQENIIARIADLRPVDLSKKSKRRLGKVDHRKRLPANLCDLFESKPHLFLDLGEIGKAIS